MTAPSLQTLRDSFSGRLLTDDSDTAPFLLDWRKRWHGRAIAVAQPDTAQDVAAVVRWCVANGVPVVPQGGNTGLSGGCIPDDSGRALVLSLARLNRVRGMDTVNNTITVEAGCILEQVQQAAEAADRMFPLSLAAQGSCTIGGNLSTNAGGVQVIRFGNTRELCLGLEVVTAEGELWDGLRGLRKDNTGYDLRDLYIGSEGTLGVITAAVMKMVPLPAARVCAFVAVPSPDVALQLLELSQSRLGSALTAFELISETCLGLVLRHFPDSRRPLADASPWYVLMEVSDLDSQERAVQSIEATLETAMENGWVSDAALTSSVAQFKAFWALRENISEAQGAEGKNIKHDIAVPISRVAEFIRETNALIAAAYPGTRMVVFGHLGDGNLHYNVSPPAGETGAAAEAAFMALQDPINLITHDAVARMNGSVSAEHGLGVLRRDEAARYKSPVEMALMKRLKAAFDPKGLMNPGKYLA